MGVGSGRKLQGHLLPAPKQNVKLARSNSADIRKQPGSSPKNEAQTQQLHFWVHALENGKQDLRDVFGSCLQSSVVP